MNSRKKLKSPKRNDFGLLMIFVGYSSSSRVTTCSVTRFAMLQDIGVILSGIEGNNHIFSIFLSQSYPWDNKYSHSLSGCLQLFHGDYTTFYLVFILVIYLLS